MDKTRYLTLHLPDGATIEAMNNILSKCENAIAPILSDGDRVHTKLLGARIETAYIEFRLSRGKLNIHYTLAVKFLPKKVVLCWANASYSPCEAIEEAISREMSNLAFVGQIIGWKEDFPWNHL